MSGQVASGVSSRGESPVPPSVRMICASASAACAIASRTTVAPSATTLSVTAV